MPTNSATNNGLSVSAYAGINNVLLGFNLDKAKLKNFAGFAIEITPPKGSAFWFQNRLSFNAPIQNTTTPQERVSAMTNSNVAPIQEFHVVYSPDDSLAGNYTFAVTAMYFNASGALINGATVSVKTPLLNSNFYPQCQIGFTRCMISSQEYVAKFQNKPIIPKVQTIDFDTTPYLDQYQWLGSDARQILFDFLEQAVKDPTITVDALVYDIDEPDVIKQLVKLGKRLRVFFDDSRGHQPPALEAQVWKLIEASAGTANVKFGHFQRFQHNKVLIQKQNGKVIRVFTGSMNFSIRGLYVQANNVLLLEDPAATTLYSQAFDQMWSDPTKFSNAAIAAQWFPLKTAKSPPMSLCFSPHKLGANAMPISLSSLFASITDAKHSVHFVIMEIADADGKVSDDLNHLYQTRKDIFSYGLTQNTPSDTPIGSDVATLKVKTPGASSGVLVPFSYIKNQSHPPFDQEMPGGSGIVIHDKFVVVDFNGPNPVVFTGSSNLSQDGELDNGDNILQISDPVIATAYGVEAVRLIDHFRFRAALFISTDKAPLQLSKGNWYQCYYDPTDEHFQERMSYIAQE